MKSPLIDCLTTDLAREVKKERELTDLEAELNAKLFTLRENVADVLTVLVLECACGGRPRLKTMTRAISLLTKVRVCDNRVTL